MSIRDLKTFLLIAENGSFASAARAIYRTQSAVTAQIQALEDELGVLLFDRTNRPPTLTEAARNFIPRAREVVNAYDALFRNPGEADFRGDLRLGVVPSAMTGLTPRFLVLLGERYPGLHVELAMGLSAELVSKVERGVLDAALISDPWEVNSSLNWSPFLREPLVLIAPIDAPQKPAKELLRIYPFMRYTESGMGRKADRARAGAEAVPCAGDDGTQHPRSDYGDGACRARRFRRAVAACRTAGFTAGTRRSITGPGHFSYVGPYRDCRPSEINPEPDTTGRPQ